MNQRIVFHITVWSLLLLGLGLFIGRAYLLKVPVSPERDVRIWEVELTARAKPKGGPAEVSFRLPPSRSAFKIIDQEFSAPGYSLGIRSVESERVATFSRKNVRDEGKHLLSYRFTIEKSAIETTLSLDDTIRQVVLPTEDQTLLKKAVKTLKKNVSNGSRDKMLIAALFQSKKSPELLREQFSFLESTEERLAAATYLKVPARMRYGLRLFDSGRGKKLRPIVEFESTKKRYTFDLRTKKFGKYGEFLIWGKESNPIEDFDGMQSLSTDLSVSAVSVSPGRERARPEGTLEEILHGTSIRRLPVGAQTVFSILLLLPLAGLVIAIIRNVIGLRTFGTFMPALIALSLIETGILRGTGVLLLILSLGLGLRLLFSRLKLLLVPRLTAVLSSVILVLYLLALGSVYLELDPALTVGLFPVIVITMMVERMSIVIEEIGVGQGLLQLLGSLVAAFAAYYIVTVPQVYYVCTTFPEYLLIALALSFILGRYTGFRLFELFRFRTIANSPRT